MTEQLALLELGPTGRVRHADPATSVAAARKQRGRAETVLLAVLADAYPAALTADELCDRCIDRYDDAYFDRGSLKSALSRLKRPADRAPYIEPAGEGTSRRGCAMARWRWIPPRRT